MFRGTEPFKHFVVAGLLVLACSRMGLAGEGTPMESSIVALADTYDALSSARPYKPAYPENKVLAIMRDETGGQFDPAVFAAFERSTDDFRAIRLELSDGNGSPLTEDLRDGTREEETAVCGR